MKRGPSVLICVLLVTVILLTACTAAPVPPTATSAPVQPTATARPVPTATAMPKYIFAVDATWPPFEYVDEQTKAIVGYDIDLVNAIAAKEGFEVEIVNVAWDPLLAGVAQCQYDAAISSVSITEDRKVTMAFSDPYFTVGQQVIVQAENTDILGKDSLVGKRVGAQLGTTGSLEVKKMAGVESVDYNNIGLAFQDLINGQIDAVVADNVMALGYVGKNPDKLKAAGEPFTGESIAAAVCKTNTELVNKINSGLAKLVAEKYFDKLADKWLKTQTPE
jgi:polar amino acid transport system substrate-binding protein